MGRNRKTTHGRLLQPPAHSYSMLLIALLGLWLVSPLMDFLHAQQFSSAFFISVTMIAACYAMSDQGKSFVLVVVLGIALGVMVWIDLPGREGMWGDVATQTVALVFFGVVAYELLVDILSKESKVDSNLIAGAIAVYLLIGVCFSFVYELTFTLNPESFKGVGGSASVHTTFTYFSFVTMTTLGYGDITPLTKIGGTFATLQAIIGQLYLTVLVARLVGMHISQASDS